MSEIADNFYYVKIFSPFEVFFEGEITALTAANGVGEFAILKNHANFITILPAGRVSVLTRFGKREVDITRGILKVANNRAILFSNV